MLQMLILQERTIHSRVISRCKPCRDGNSGFSNCSVIWMGKVTCIVSKTTDGVRKNVNDGLSKTLVGALPHWTVWMDERSTFLVS